jgi:carboxypeptidase family protein
MSVTPAPVWLAVFAYALSGGPAWAQLDQGRLIGTVRDSQGGVMPGVTVTAKSASLIGGQSTVTGTNGSFRFPSLPPGTYTLTFELPGFKTYDRSGIALALGTTLTVDVQMQVATLNETVTVSAASPVVDTQATKIGSEFSGAKLTAVPSATDLWATLAQAPGVRMRGFDVGGSHKSQQSAYESFGIRSQNRVVTEGVDTTEGTGGAGFYQDYFAHQEIAVSAAGTDVTMSTPGAAVVSAIKSGGNQFSGLENITYEGRSFVGNNIDRETAARGFTGQPNLLFYEGHADLGGPVKRDKMWFYTAYNHFKIDKAISGVDQNVATDLGVFDTYVVKGTGKLTPSDTLIGYYQWGRKQKPLRGLAVTVPPESILAQDSKSWMYNGQHQRVWTNRLFTDVKVGLFGFGWPMKPAVDFKTKPPRLDLDTGIQSGAGFGGGPFEEDRNKPQINVTATYYVPGGGGSHDLKVGYEYVNDQLRYGLNGLSGPIRYRDRAGEVAEVEVWDFGTPETFGTDWGLNDDRDLHHAAFAQDRWSVSSRVTLTLGARFDHQRPYYLDATRKPVLTDIFEASTSSGRTLLRSNKLTPRLGISYDMFGSGKTVLKGFYGRYYFNFADRLTEVDPGGANSRRYVFNDANGNRRYDGPQELGRLLSTTGGSSTSLDPNLKTPFTDEFDVSLEKQFWGETSMRTAYVRKQTRDDFTTFVPARIGRYTIPLNRAVIIQGFDGGTQGTQTFALFDVPTGLPTENVVATIPGGGDFNFDTIQLALNKRFGAGLFIQSSYDYQWRDELRNPNSSSTSPLTADPIATDYYQNNDAFPAVPNLQNSTNWNYRLLGRYEFPYRIGFGVNWRVQSGWPYARRITVTLPNAGTVRFFAEPIENNRSDTVSILDFRLDKTFAFAGNHKVSLFADAYNVLNSNPVTNFNLLNGSQFNRIVATLDPRTVQIGARLEF